MRVFKVVGWGEPPSPETDLAVDRGLVRRRPSLAFSMSE
jgi:hypothetical protein